jgi:AraC-like DNA-binding protein
LEYVQRVRIEEAKQQLETDGRGIDRISAEVGYSDVASFRRLFKRMVGETPAAYRKRQSVSTVARAISQMQSDAHGNGAQGTSA